MGLSIIIPVKPPEPYLENLISDIFVKYPEAEILVQKEKGLGAAIKAGVTRAHGDLIAVLDADGSHDPRIISLALIWFSENDNLEVVVGSRYSGRGYSRDRIPRKIISLFFTALARILCPCYVRDPLSGFVIARKRLFAEVNWTRGYKFGIYLLRYCYKKGRGIGEIGFIFKRRQKGASKANPLTAVKALKDLLILRSRT